MRHRSVVAGVSVQPIRPIFRVQQSKTRFGETYPSHFSVSSSPRDVSGLHIRPIFRVQQYKKRFGKTYPSHFVSISITDFRDNLAIPFSGSSSPRNVSGNPILPIFRFKHSNRRLGKTHPSHFQGPAVRDTFRENLSVQFLGSSSPRDVSGQHIRSIFRSSNPTDVSVKRTAPIFKG